MRLVVQRVKESNVKVDNKIVGQIIKFKSRSRS